MYIYLYFEEREVEEAMDIVCHLSTECSEPEWAGCAGLRHPLCPSYKKKTAKNIKLSFFFLYILSIWLILWNEVKEEW